MAWGNVDVEEQRMRFVIAVKRKEKPLGTLAVLTILAIPWRIEVVIVPNRCSAKRITAYLWYCSGIPVSRSMRLAMGG